MEERKLYKYRCEVCGAEIHSVWKKRIIKCEACLKRERSKRSRDSTNSPYRKHTSNADLRHDIVKIEEYNKLHGTEYSYGQFKSLKFLGKI